MIDRSTATAPPFHRARHRRHGAVPVIAALASAGMLHACGGGGSDVDAQAAATPTVPGSTAPAFETGKLQSIHAVTVLSRDVLVQTIASYPSAPVLPQATCDVEVDEIVYTTAAPDGTPTTASAAVMIPSGAACPATHAVVSYTRGTDLQKTRSMTDFARGEVAYVASLLAGAGYVVVSTDYLGYNKSTWPRHYYLHADSEAQAQIDGLRAARSVLAARQYAVDPKIYLAGYSQGGHASMATHRLISERHAAEFPLAGAAHMSGPYNLQRSIRSAIDAMPLGTIGSTLYVPFALTSLQAVYGNLYRTPSDYFRSPYDTTIDGLFPNTMDSQQLLESGTVPLTLAQVATDQLVADVRSDTSALQGVLAANSPMRFRSTVPTMLCGGRRDGVVSFDNAADAQATMLAAGSAPVTVVDVESVPGYADHLPPPLSPAALMTNYHASNVPPLCLAQLRQFFATLPSR